MSRVRIDFSNIFKPRVVAVKKEAWIDITRTTSLALEDLVKKLPEGKVVEWERERVKIAWK